MKQHTPGPWRADDNGDGTHCITAGRGCDVADTRSSDNEQANARLIAAAPDLLAACIAAADWLTPETYDSEEQKDLHRELLNAIAKAKGQS